VSRAPYTMFCVNTKPTWSCLGLLTLVIFANSTATLLADGCRLPDQDAFATARGEAFVATADNASAIYYNPAGISQLKGGNFRGRIYGIYLPVSYKSPSGRSFNNEKDLQAVPRLFFTYTPNESRLSSASNSKFHLGVGRYEIPQTTFSGK
jgi:long-chain fatty acid transport protein